MDKRLTRSDYVFSLIFVFLLVCVAGAFFFGVQIGSSRAETKYEALLAQKEEASKIPGAYDQQLLVSFYHTIYAPYREFSNRWFDKLKELELQADSVDASAVMKDLAKLADEKYAELANAATPESSPLLGEAHQNLMKGLKLFADTSKKFQSKANAMHPGVVATEIDKDAFFQEAKKFVLLGQQQYYASIVKWNETVEQQVKGAALLGKNAYTLADWSQMGLNVKNTVVASMLLNEKRFMPLYPQDMTVRIDEMIANGQVKKLNLNDIQSIVDMLGDTNAARKGDFIQRKDKWYAGETMPQLPFFYENK
ncbi:hypothetical protein [Paenibacillus flagellatus]|uniref:Uncharacterized protein n=1 Tax=Paenibacillus flagellatus TaxID=2211139 RepID=A0A2V5KJW0_9BACL|nr:hypothetical protein [Paenibacillus flagellatus]PYI54970.1 hypothetical protein DLM86_10510 [Paenibacillus flagellatus]